VFSITIIRFFIFLNLLFIRFWFDLNCGELSCCGESLEAYFCCLFLLLVVKTLFHEFSCGVITDDHALALITNITFIADVRASKSIVPSYHHTPYLRSL